MEEHLNARCTKSSLCAGQMAMGVSCSPACTFASQPTTQGKNRCGRTRRPFSQSWSCLSFLRFSRLSCFRSIFSRFTLLKNKRWGEVKPVAPIALPVPPRRYSTRHHVVPVQPVPLRSGTVTGSVHHPVVDWSVFTSVCLVRQIILPNHIACYMDSNCSTTDCT